jgi:hypothetical protein
LDDDDKNGVFEAWQADLERRVIQAYLERRVIQAYDETWERMADSHPGDYASAWRLWAHYYTTCVLQPHSPWEALITIPAELFTE